MLLFVSWILAAGLLRAGSLTFDKPEQTFDLAPDVQTVVADFHFENKTGKPVTIAKVERTCSCQDVRIARGKLVYQPGEKGIIRAEFDLANFSGQVVKQTLVWEAGDPEDKPSAVLLMKGTIPELVQVAPKSLNWNIGEAPASRKSVVTVTGDKPVKVTRVFCSPDNFDLKWHAVKEGSEYEIEATPRSTAAPLMSVIHVETDCAVSRQKKKLIYAVIGKPAPPPRPARRLSPQ